MNETVAICALTYHRPVGLTRLLDGLESLDIPYNTTAMVVIVDNDPGCSARSVIEARSSAFTHELSYVNEPARGIAAARNAAVAFALERRSTAICFIDDDEWPDEHWLREFLSTREATGADIVTGPVFPVYEKQPPRWVTTGRFFERRRHEHNEQIRYATTSTVLISTACFAGRPDPFNVAFGLSGGEDTHLFAQLREAGFKTFWCDSAHVYEAVPASRMNSKWLLQREYRRGQTLSLSLRHRSPRPMQYARRIANGVIQSVHGTLRMVVGIPRGRAGWLNGVKQIVFGAGMLTGLAGRRYEEYRKIHGK